MGLLDILQQYTDPARAPTDRVHQHFDEVARQTDPAWQTDYTTTRPKVERKIGHLMRRKHGGRRARMRGLAKVAADFSLLAAAVNLAHLGKLGLASTTTGTWTVATT